LVSLKPVDLFTGQKKEASVFDRPSAAQLLNPLSLTPSRLPRFSANERRPFPHGFSFQKGKNRGESDIPEMKLSDFPCFSSTARILYQKDRWCGQVACGAQNFFANAIGTGNTPLHVDAIDEGNDSKTLKSFGCLTGKDTKISFGQSQPCEMSSRPIKKGSSASGLTRRGEGV